MQSNNQKENKTTIQMIRMFQDSVRDDIRHTDMTLKLVQEKLNKCDSNLSSLKQKTSELNIDFGKIEKQMDNLNSSLKLINSVNSIDIEALLSNDTDEVDKSYVFVRNNKEGVTVHDYDVSSNKRGSISSNNSSESSVESIMSEEEEERLVGTDKLVNDNCNELIRMLMENS